MKKLNSKNLNSHSFGKLLFSFLAMTVFALSADGVSAAEAGMPAIQSQLPSGVSLSDASDAEIKTAVKSMLEKDPANAGVNVAEAVSQLGKDDKRIDALLTSTIAGLKEGTEPGTSDFKSTKDFKSTLGFDCELVRQIWALSIQASPDKEQLILEVGVREAPECFEDFIAEGYSETGTIIRSFTTDVGLFGGRNVANTSTNDGDNDKAFSAASGGESPVNSPED